MGSTLINLFKVFFPNYIMEKITKQFCVKKHKKGYYNLNDIVKNIIKSKSPISYMDKISGKKRIGTIFYITEDQFIKILKKSRSATGKEAYKLLKESDENNQTTEIVDSRVDSDNNLFSFNGKGLKIVNVGDEIWFKGKDVAKILEYENTKDALKKHLEQDDKITYDKLKDAITHHLSKSVEMKEVNNLKGSRFATPLKSVKSEQPHTIFINESGLYSLILRSRMEAAKKFKRWVTKEVLPTIRKTGSYSIKNQPKLLYDLNNFKNKSCFYIINIRDNLYKYGISDNMARRGNDHLNNFKNPKIIKIIELKNYSMCKEIEKNVTFLVKQINIKCSYDLDKDKIFKDHKKNLKKECFITNEKYNIDYVLNKVDEYINFYDDTPDGEFNLELAIIKEKTKQYFIRKEKKIRGLELQKEKTISELQLKIELKRLEIEKLKLRNNQNNHHIEINDNFIEDSEEKEESEYEQFSDTNTTSSESEEEQNNLKTNKCLDCNTSIYESSKRCIKCNSKLRFKMGTQKRKVIKRPTHKQLKKDLEKSSYVKVGKKYNVSDNCIRKWLKTYEKYKN